MHFPMVVNWQEKECGHDAKEGTDKDSVYSSVPLKSIGLNQWRIYIVKFWTCYPPGSKFFQFHAVFGKIWQNRMLAPPPPELAPPPRGNPGFATVYLLFAVLANDLCINSEIGCWPAINIFIRESFFPEYY